MATDERDYIRERNRRLDRENRFLRETSEQLIRMVGLLARIATEDGRACHPLALAAIVCDLTATTDAGMLHPEATLAREGQAN